MLHAAEILCHGADAFVADQSLHRRHGSHVVFDVMDTGQQNILHIEYLLPPAHNPVPLLPNAVGGSLPGEEMGLPRPGKSGGNGIVGIEHQQIPRLLEAENIFLGLHIFFHVLVDIQMVGGQIGNHRPLGAAGHIHQLEGAELHHRIVLRLHPAAQGQQGRADIAPQPHGFPCRFQHFRNQRGGGGFAVGAGDGNQMAGGHPEKHVHFRGDFRPLLPQAANGGISRMHSRCAEHHIRL